MPLTRYQLRNEYSLADPELYRAANRDDPEELLEGVTMAGLVGVLRQLGDLAEFAAEIFHDLHEEVMATASRGHGLMIRVQQLEAEFPIVEKAYLSQTSHSLFLCNAGIDWHPNLQMDQNLITRGDLPRFVMDSYEECRGPPRLFLLDKFDIAGAGACLKRYSDPSFFKAELISSEATKAEVQMGKKAHKIKKKGSRWRNRETPEVFPTSHARLHQLFLEEHSQTENNSSMHRVKLKKRQSNGFLFDSRTGKGYMERFLETRSPESRYVCKSSVSPQRPKMNSSSSSELGPEIHEISARSPAYHLLQRDRSLFQSPNRQEKVREPSLDELGEDVIKEGNFKNLPEPTPDIEVEKIPSTSYKLEDQKESLVGGESKTEASADGYLSDDVISEMDNYMDALTTMESEMETDTESRPKNERGFFRSGRQGMNSNTNEEQQELQARFSDSHSIGNSSASDDGNNSLKKQRSSFFYSDTPSNLAENVPLDGDVAAKVHQSTEVCSAEIVDIPSEELSESGDVLGTRSLEYLVPNGTCNELSVIPSHRSEFGQASCNSCVTDSTSTLSHLSPGANLSEVQLVGPDSVEISSGSMKAGTKGSSSNAKEEGKLGGDLPSTINVSDFPSRTRDDFLPMGSCRSQPVKMLDGGTPGVSSDALLHLLNISDLALEKNDDDDDALEMLPTEYAEDSFPMENSINGQLGSPHSISLSTEENLHCLAEHDLHTGLGTTSPADLLDSPIHSDLDDVNPDGVAVEIENVIPSTGENSEFLTSVVDHPETGDFAEQKFSGMTDEIPPIELDSAEVDIACSEVETSYNDVEVVSNTSDCKVKDGPDRVHLNSFGTKGNNSILVLPSGCMISNIPNPASAAEHSPLDGLVTGTIHAEADNDDTIVGPLSSPSGDHMKLQEECLSSSGDSDQYKLEITEASSPNYLIGSDAQKEAMNQPSVAPTEFSFELCNPELYDPSGSEILDGVHDSLLVEHTQNHYLSYGDGACAPTSLRESDQVSELKQPPQSDLSESAEHAMSPSTHLLPKLGAPFEQVLELQVDQLNVGSLHEDRESPKLIGYGYEQTETPNQIDRNGCFNAPSESSSMDPLSQPPEPEISQLPASNNFESCEPPMSPSIFPSFGLLPGASHQQLLDPHPIRPLLEFPLTDTPPLPPLPPVQWRMGKLRQGSLTSEGKVVQPCLDPFSSLSPATSDEKAQWGFPVLEEELAQPLNPFLSHSAIDDEKPQHGSQMLGREMMQPSLNEFSSLVPVVGDEKIQQDFLTLEGKIAQPLNPFLSLPAIEYEKPQHGSLTLGGETVQPGVNPFALSSTIEDANSQHASLTLDKEMALPSNSLTPLPNREIEKPQHTSLTLEGEMVPPPSSFTPPPTMEDKKPPPTIEGKKPPPTLEDEMLQHGSLPLEGEMVWQSNSYAVLPTLEDGKPNGSHQDKLPRPRDPLIEAVASHDKSTLRKVMEQVQPQIGPKVYEMDSLLEQIRTKSFNLKPAVVMRPSIQGPKTNLKVSAILEKANSIRQALVGTGSDEDDDTDSWSDS